MMTPDMVRNQLENEQAAVPGHGLVRNAGSADAGGLSPPLFSPSSFPPSPRSNPSAIFCKRISYRF
ncbi:Uncharacterised protein [Klebsiella pneumoniae subsp. rhinoscleromatis]|nr:Uncharacterised protein [Klebsiella pneumoniae subsp. rhinoscleromatis]